jgi:hypothetical protein
MALDFVGDFDASFTDFGVLGTLGGATVRGILDEGPGLAFGSAIGGTEPRFTLRSSDLPADPRLVQLVIGARTFNVRDWSTDGTGLAVLILEDA